MARSDIPSWALVGALVGMVASYIVTPSYSLIGAVIGGAIGYMFGKSVR